jgi:hypothetical protein
MLRYPPYVNRDINKSQLKKLGSVKKGTGVLTGIVVKFQDLW